MKRSEKVETFSLLTKKNKKYFYFFSLTRRRIEKYSTMFVYTDHLHGHKKIFARYRIVKFLMEVAR